MIPYILAAIGGYFIGQSRKDEQYADGGMTKTRTESRKEKIKLYHHKTSGGAEYLCSSKVKGTKDEGSLDSKYVVRIDGAKKHGGELMIKQSMSDGGMTKKQFNKGDMVYVISDQQPFKNYFAEVVSVGQKFSKVEDEEGEVHTVDNNQIQIEN